MKKTIFAILKVLVPIALGVWLVLDTYGDLSLKQRDELFAAFGEANVWWLLFSVFLGWCSHLSRAWRWRYLLGHLSYKVEYWNAYNATMVGYFMNMVLPRAGEASRAVTLYRTEGVPFERGFGTILAERAVDAVMLLSIVAITVALQWDNLDVLSDRVAAFRAQQDAQGESFLDRWGTWLLVLLALAAIGAGYIIWSRPALRARAKDGFRGFVEGVKSVFQTKDKGAFILHTFIIWGCYVGMCWVGFNTLPTTAEVPPAGIMAGFIAGSVGIILVQGGIGVFPAFVALVVGMYMAPPEGGGLIRPDALAMGWLLWVSQTIMIIALGGVSLLLVSRNRKKALA